MRAKNATLPCGRPASASDHPKAQAAPRWPHWEEKLRAYLEKSGLKHSEQRLKIMRFILALPGHFRIQELARRIQADTPGLGAATVYRNVKTLVDAGILRETLVDEEGQTVYELLDEAGGHHDHIVCLDCRQIFEFHDEKIEDIQHSVAGRMKFSEVSHRHVIYAHCQYARSAQPAKKP